MRRAERAGGSRGRALAAPRIAPRAAVILAIVLWPARRLSAQTSDEVQKAADGAIRRLDLQTEFPRVPEPTNFDFHLPPETLWIVVALAVAILLYTFREQLMALRFGAGTQAWAEQEGEPSPTPGNEALLLEAADELAAAGRFVEAMHVLLLQGLGYIRQRLNQQLSDSLTSREILYSTNLPQGARAPLRDVIARVELTYFGERPAGLADYTACRESFHALAQALQGSAA
jgi:hypothetical protein